DGLCARRDHHFAGVDRNAAPASRVLGDRLAQLGKPGGRAIMRPAVAQGARGRVDDVVRGGEVRLADLEVNDVAALGLELPGADEDLKRPFRAQARHALGESKFLRSHRHLESASADGPANAKYAAGG